MRSGCHELFKIGSKVEAFDRRSCKGSRTVADASEKEMIIVWKHFKNLHSTILYSGDGEKERYKGCLNVRRSFQLGSSAGKNNTSMY